MLSALSAGSLRGSLSRKKVILSDRVCAASTPVCFEMCFPKPAVVL